jgi:hypothetical protein
MHHLGRERCSLLRFLCMQCTCMATRSRMCYATLLCVVQMGRAVATQPLGKHTLPTVLWDKLESTPCGHNAAPDGSCVLKPVDEKLAELQRSRVPMDHYTFPTGREARTCCTCTAHCSHRNL